MKKLFEQIVKFGIVGAIAFVIDYAVLFVLVQFLHMDSIIAATISFTVSVILQEVNFESDFDFLVAARVTVPFPFVDAFVILYLKFPAV